MGGNCRYLWYGSFEVVRGGPNGLLVLLQVDELEGIEFMGDRGCLLARLSCSGRSASTFPIPKQNMWTLYPIFHALGDRSAEQSIEESQPRGATLQVLIVRGIELDPVENAS